MIPRIPISLSEESCFLHEVLMILFSESSGGDVEENIVPAGDNFPSGQSRQSQLIREEDRNCGTWDESVFLAKKNPPPLPSSFLVWERCQVSPKKISKSGHWRILRKRTFCT